MSYVNFPLCHESNKFDISDRSGKGLYCIFLPCKLCCHPGSSVHALLCLAAFSRKSMYNVAEDVICLHSREQTNSNVLPRSFERYYSTQYRVLESVLCAINQTSLRTMKMIKFMADGEMLPKFGSTSDVIIKGYLKLSTRVEIFQSSTETLLEYPSNSDTRMHRYFVVNHSPPAEVLHLIQGINSPTH